MKKVIIICSVMFFGLINFVYADKIINNNNSNGGSCSESELQAKYEAGKQFCIDNPSKCGLSEKDEDA
ncbi:MAG: hypothetical protein HQK69_09590, partial [Desulfamplus sp.]|nr:hypothetical protein [Desulfamplus sp.]